MTYHDGFTVGAHGGQQTRGAVRSGTYPTLPLLGIDAHNVFFFIPCHNCYVTNFLVSCSVVKTQRHKRGVDWVAVAQ
jgi:hypothetical protein